MNVYFSLTGSISEVSVNSMIAFINSKVFDQNYTGIIIIYISNIGGDMDSAIRAYDFLKNLKNKVITIGFSQVDSSAIPVFLAGDERIAHANTRFRFHEPTYNMGLEKASLYTFKERVNFFEELDSRTKQIYFQESNISEKIMISFGRSGKIIKAEDAIKLGIAHKISKDIPNINDFS